MAASITFDFLSRGGPALAGQFKSVGDNAAAAARGAKVLQTVIGELGTKENRTAAESKILASALRQTGEAEDRVAARAVLADAAIRRLDDAMQDSSKDTAKARGEVTGLARALDGLKGHALAGSALLAIPALATLGGVGAGAAAGIGGAFVAAAGGLAAYGAVAKSVLSASADAAKKVTTAQENYNAVIASGAKKAVAYKAEQAAIAKAYAGMSPAQIQLSKTLAGVTGQWGKFKAGITPVIASSLTPWLGGVTGGLSALKLIVTPMAGAVGVLGGEVSALVSSQAFKTFAGWLGKTGAGITGTLGEAMVQVIDGLITILPKFTPLMTGAADAVGGWAASFDTWSGSKKASDQISAFLGWFKANGPAVGGLIRNLGKAIGNLAPGLASGGLLELKVISGFLGLVAKLPKGIAGPLAEVAGALLILNKLGVLKVGVKIVGAAVKWLTGGSIEIGGGAEAAAAMRAAFTTGGAAAAAEIRAALTGAAVPGAAGAAGAGGAAKGGAFALTTLTPVLIGAAAGIALGIYLRQYHAQDHPAPAAQQGPRGTGGAAGPAAAGINAWKTYDHLLNQAGIDADNLRTRNLVPLLGEVGRVSGGVQGLSGIMQNTLLAGLRAAGAHSDNLRTRNLTPLRGEVGQVSGGIQGLAGYIRNSLAPAMNTGGQHADNLRLSHLGPLSSQLYNNKQRVDFLGNAIRGLPSGKTINVGVHAAGSGGMSFTEKVAASISSGGFSLRSLAGGGMITQGTGPRADDVPIMASRGELVVPAHLVPSVKPVLGGKIPGFASGGIAGMIPWTAGAEAGFARSVGADLLRKEFAHLKAAVKANAVGPASGGGHTGWVPGAGVNQWRLTTLKALGMLGLPGGLVLDVLYQMLTESGGNPNAVNRTDSNWIAGHPSVGLMQVIRGTFGTYAGPFRGTGPFLYGVSTNPLANIYAALNYGKHNGRGFGTGLGQIGSGHGYASGGLVGAQGAAYLKAWQARHGGGYGAAWGPVPVGPQIGAADRVLARDATLARAALPASQHRHYVAAAAWWRRHRDALVHERGVMRDWRGQLAGSDAAITSWIGAAGTTRALAPSVQRWKHTRAVQEKEIAAVSKMLGLTGAQQAAAAKAHPKAKPPAGPPLPAITHTYGGITDVIEAFLASVAAPFGAARGALVADRGATLRPGWNPPMFNATGRPEQLVPARGGGGIIRLEVAPGGGSEFDRFMTGWLRKHVKIKGGGDAQRAWGSH